MADRQLVEAFLVEPRTAIVIGLRSDGRPHATPNWFSYDGKNFYVSTTKTRAKYRIFCRDPRVELVVDDGPHMTYVSVSGRVEICEDIENYLPIFRTTREKYSVAVPSDAEFLAELRADQRVLLRITPDEPIERWSVRL